MTSAENADWTLGEAADRAAFLRDGFLVTDKLLTDEHLALANKLVADLLARYQSGESAVVAAGVSVADAAARLRQPKPDVAIPGDAPFVIGDLLALDPRFAEIFAAERIWRHAALLLGCPQDQVVFHFSNITRKPALYGTAIGWHRDADNTYFAAADENTLRMLICLQPMSESNGGTCVAAYSHLREDKAAQVRQYPAVAAGAGLTLHARTLHGGGPNRSAEERDLIVLQFGVAGSVLTHQTTETLSLSGRSEFLRASPTLPKARYLTASTER